MVMNEEILIHTLLVVFDLAGTFVFALSGGMDGVKHRLDRFGVLVLSFATGNSGGILRDVLIGRFHRQRSATGATSQARFSPG